MRLFRLFIMALVLASLLCVGSSAKFSPSSVSNAHRTLSNSGKENGDIIQNLFDSFQNIAQSFQSLVPEKIEGLATIKQFLYEIGFMAGPPPYTDFIDRNVKQALTDFQMFFKLNVTGTLDNSTLQQMSLPRCGVPDKILSQTTLQNLSWPVGNTWLKGKKNIAYGFLPESEILTDMMVVIQDAFNRWSNATAMNFTETAEISAANITIGFYSFVDMFNDTIYSDVVLKLDSQGKVTAGAIHLDAEKYWVLPSVNDSFTWPFGAVDLGTVVMHHIGYLVGLPHSSAEEAVMYPYILPWRERKLQLSNVLRIKL